MESFSHSYFIISLAYTSRNSEQGQARQSIGGAACKCSQCLKPKAEFRSVQTDHKLKQITLPDSLTPALGTLSHHHSLKNERNKMPLKLVTGPRPSWLSLSSCFSHSQLGPWLTLNNGFSHSRLFFTDFAATSKQIFVFCLKFAGV